ncbi:MAG: MGMT family protein [Desulfurococcales archaeon]|nr:MGMT family protein [Desulfurococcales archaeon]
MGGLRELAPIAYTLLQLVSPGRVTTYSSLAKVLGTSPRVVGQLMAMNPDPVVVPCHRVVRSDGSLGGYSMGGPRVKRRLLEMEGVTFDWRGRVRRVHIIYIDKMLLDGSLFPEDLGEPQPPEVE